MKHKMTSCFLGVLKGIKVELTKLKNTTLPVVWSHVIFYEEMKRLRSIFQVFFELNRNMVILSCFPGSVIYLQPASRKNESQIRLKANKYNILLKIYSCLSVYYTSWLQMVSVRLNFIVNLHILPASVMLVDNWQYASLATSSGM